MATDMSQNIPHQWLLACSPLVLFTTYLKATASSLDKVKRSLLLLGNMAVKIRVNKPEAEQSKE